MSSEIFWLTLTTMLTAHMFVPYAYNRVAKIKLIGAFRRGLPGDAPFAEAWGHRAYRAHMNAFEDLIIFAPLVLAVEVTGAGNAFTAAACAIHFFARLAHAFVYWLDLPWTRLPTYLVGLFSSVALGIVLLVQV